jgi:hypothetical protein
MTVLATLYPGTKGNWISQRIVKRLGLQPCPDELVRGADFDGKYFKSTGRYVDVACYRDNSNDTRCHRFYVVEHVLFDVLFGSDTLASYEIVSARQEQGSHMVSYPKRSSSAQQYSQRGQQRSSKKR